MEGATPANSLPGQLCLPAGAKHLTFNYDSRKQVTGMPLTFIFLAQFCLFATLLRGGLNPGLDTF